MSWVLEVQPLGLRIPLEPGANLLTALRQAGFSGDEQLYAPCGGRGTCGQCKVKICSGSVSQPSRIELRRFSAEELAAGYRLACQTQALGSLKVELPPESLARKQQLQVEGEACVLNASPALVTKTVSLQATTVAYPLTVWEQLRRSLSASGSDRQVSPGLELLRRVPARAQAESAHCLLRSGELLDLRFDNPPFTPLGLAVDLGTTKIAAFLLDLVSAKLLAADAIMNPQIPFGEDLMSRLAYALSDAKAADQLSVVVAQGLDRLLGELLATTGRTRDEVYEIVIAGNPAMHHLLLKLPVEQLGRAPYVPAINSLLTCDAASLGIRGAAKAEVQLLPAVSGFIGGDHLAMILGAGIHQSRKTVLGLDIGTNTEIVLARQGELVSCSCASGPAFEGAHIYQGMRAVEGAICRVRMSPEGAIQYETIGDRPPRGFCGSGILDSVAELARLGIVNSRGLLDKQHPRVRHFGEAGSAFCLVDGAQSGSGHDIVITQKDISEIQLAKGAVATGVKILLKECGTALAEVDEVVVAGAFGTHLDIDSAIRIGLFPALPRERFRQVGNAAGSGAQGVLLSADMHAAAIALGARLRCLELTRQPNFAGIFARALHFPQMTENQSATEDNHC